MPAANLVKYHTFPLDLGSAVHDFTSHTFKVALTNTAPVVATDTSLVDVGEITAANGYPAGGLTLTGVTFVADGSGGATFDAPNSPYTFTSTGNFLGPFRYAVLYNSTADRLIGYYDYGGSLQLGDTETFDFDVPTELFDIV